MTNRVGRCRVQMRAVRENVHAATSPDRVARRLEPDSYRTTRYASGRPLPVSRVDRVRACRAASAPPARSSGSYAQAPALVACQQVSVAEVSARVAMFPYVLRRSTAGSMRVPNFPMVCPGCPRGGRLFTMFQDF